MQQKYLPEELLRKYNDGTCNEDEKAVVESWHLHELSKSSYAPSVQSIDAAYVKGRKAIIAYAHQSSPVRKLWPRMAAAASIIICLGIVAYFVLTNHKVPDIAPGGNKAYLTLANGNRIVLDSLRNGTLSLQGIANITKTKNGSITYQSTAGQASNVSKVGFNTLTTPVGGQYQLILADGTQVWLNAASSIKFPISFSAKERKVEITGEAYFEVAHDSSKPFRVVSSNQTVQVLGTHFNINAYADEENIRTTLLEGSVKIATGNHSIILAPGQQAGTKGGQLSIDQADVDEAVAWKNGYFKFKDEKIGSLMRKLSRWYNIDVQYQGKASEEGFNGAISRSKNFSQVLHVLEKTNAVHFKLEGRRVTVMQ